ncbi:MAG: hypothetical protein Q9183_003253 [Haloplaca sp. 2 TL-2023]
MSSSSRKKQTRLNLTPLPSSSPVPSGLPEQIQTRAANVRYDSSGSPTKKRRVNLGVSGQSKLNFQGNAQNNADEALPTPEPSSQAEVQPEQGPRLSSTSTSESEDGITITHKHRRRQPYSGRSRRRGSSAAPQFSDDEVHSPSKMAQSPKASKLAARVTSSEESDAPSRPIRSTRKLQNQSLSKRVGPSTALVVSSEDDSKPVASGSIRRAASKQQIGPHTPRRNRRTQALVNPPSRSSRTSKEKLCRHESSQGSSQRAQTPEAAESDESADSLMNDLKHSATKPRLRSKNQILEASGGSSSKAFETPNRSDSSIKTRSSKRREVPKSAGQKRIEQLRRQRAGKADQRESDDELEIVSVGDKNSQEVAKSDVDEHSSRDVDSQQPLRDQDLDLEESETDFIDYDEQDDPINLPEVPFEFTSDAHKKPIEQFKDVIEWMVHNKLNPAFDRDKPIYKNARLKLNVEASGFASSTYMSPVWRLHFSKAVKMFPELKSTVVSETGGNCEACGRSNHPAKQRLEFAGKPYHADSLEDASSDSGDEDSEASAEKTTFFLGRDCNAKAVIAHRLLHWRYVLNTDVMDLLEAKGELTPYKVVQRDRLNQSKRQREADAVVDTLDQDGEIRTLYDEFKAMMKSARDAKEGGRS